MELMNRCTCGGTLCINVGDSIKSGKFRWYASYHCNECNKNTEMDGNGIDSIPDDIKSLLIKNEGEWGLSSSSNNLKIKYLLNKLLYNFNSTVFSKDIFYCGTQNQVRWVKNKLVEKGINENELEIKNMDNDTTK